MKAKSGPLHVQSKDCMYVYDNDVPRITDMEQLALIFGDFDDMQTAAEDYERVQVDSDQEPVHESKRQRQRHCSVP